MKLSNEMARMLCSELDLGDTSTCWNDSEWSDGDVYPNFEVVHSELIDTTRWSLVHERVYKDLDTGKYWETTYRTGATECQEERPYEYDGDEIEFIEVVPHETITIKYRAVQR